MCIDFLTAEENSGKPQLGDSLIKAVRAVNASNGVPYLQTTSEGFHRTSGREKEEKKERTGWMQKKINNTTQPPLALSVT